MPKNGIVVVSGLVVVLAAVVGCSGSSGNGDLTTVGQGQSTSGGLGGALGGGGLGGGLGGGGAKPDGGAGGTSKGGTSPGTSGSSSSGGSTASCKASTGEPACDACVEQSCCAETSACAGEAACAALASCLFSCNASDKACMQACVDEQPNGVATFRTWVGCANTRCGTSCQ